jgi:uncharacterized membrane protein YoaT (DUF817 family)
MILLVIYLIIQFKTQNKMRYFLYFVFGCVFGFYFDIVSFTQGYYSYPDIFYIKILGLPLSMTLAEGFSVAITIYIFELIKVYFNKSATIVPRSPE